ncbi:MAG: nucleoside-diphosphate kinase [Bdellovibrionaceae bacterium]|nr:nucleoside-diphosphate kinase [Bdellovibrionales bacterium]MCB9254692.1 nucleoside-diphosphate kinase [Pseudobdellovibrionaceae bacterium]
MEKTFGIIKPNAVKKNLIGKILTLIEESGLKVVEARMESLSKPQAEGFYAEHKERPFFGSLVTFMTSGPVLLFVLEGNNAVENYRKLMGATDPAKAAPGTIRKLYADSLEANSVHGSDSTASAAREVAYFFGDK